MPVRLDGACTSAPGSCARLGAVDVGPAAVVAGVARVVTDGSDEAVGAAAVDTGVASNAGQLQREANSVAKFPPASRQPTSASTRLLTNASRYSATGSSASTVAAIPTLRNWSAAVLATATDVGSLAATPMTRDSCLPSLLMRPRVISGGPFVGRGGAEGAGGGGVTDAEVSFSTWYPDA